MGSVFKVPPRDTFTYNDGRTPIGELYRKFVSLQKDGWKLEVIYNLAAKLRPQDRYKTILPIIALQSPKPGKKARWVITGIHGEEKGGPMAAAEEIDSIRELGKAIPVVFIPLCNATGYARDWRYPEQDKYYCVEDEDKGVSIGDSDHYVIRGNKAKRDKPASRGAACLTSHIVKLAREYPPIEVYDLHEDDTEVRGYVYSEGKRGIHEPIAKEMVNLLLKDSNIEMEGKTRRDENINEGVVGPRRDASIDELVSSEWIIENGRRVRGPNAEVVIVIENPSKGVPLRKRVEAQRRVIRYICEKNL